MASNIDITKIQIKCKVIELSKLCLLKLRKLSKFVTKVIYLHVYMSKIMQIAKLCSSKILPSNLSVVW